MIRGDIEGGKFERRVCLMLSRWYGSTATRQELLPFRRRSTNVQPIDGMWLGGADIVAKEETKWPFACEAKKREGWSLDQLFTGKGPLWKWWEQARANGVKHGLSPLLIFTRNNAPVYFMLEEYLWQKLAVKNQEVPLRRDPKRQHLLTAILAVEKSGMVVRVGAIDALTTMVPYSSVQSLRR